VTDCELCQTQHNEEEFAFPHIPLNQDWQYCLSSEKGENFCKYKQYSLLLQEDL
jgi:hypothetical protein